MRNESHHDEQFLLFPNIKSKSQPINRSEFSLLSAAFCVRCCIKMKNTHTPKRQNQFSFERL